MLKFIFWSLLAINAALFAYGKGYLGNFKGNEREPQRMKNQLNTDKIKFIAPGASRVAAVKPAPPAEPPAPAAAPAVAPVKLVACTLVGNFGAPEGRRFEALVAPLNFGSRQARETVTVPEVTSHIVFIPPQGSKEAADRKAEELKNLGVTNYFIMNDTSPMKWAISLGVFKSEAAAQTLLAALNKQGVASAKVAPRMSQTSKLAYRFRDIDADAKAKLDAIAARFPQQESRSCK